MFNPHPPLTGFPVVILSLAAAAELLSCFTRTQECRRFSTLLIKLLCVIAPLTYYTGYWGAEFASQTFVVSDELIAAHQNLAKLFLISLVPLLLFLLMSVDAPQRKVPRACYLICLCVSLVLVVLTSRQGGRLVFEHGAGVSAKP